MIRLQVPCGRSPSQTQVGSNYAQGECLPGNRGEERHQRVINTVELRRRRIGTINFSLRLAVETWHFISAAYCLTGDQMTVLACVSKESTNWVDVSVCAKLKNLTSCSAKHATYVKISLYLNSAETERLQEKTVIMAITVSCGFQDASATGQIVFFKKQPSFISNRSNKRCIEKWTLVWMFLMCSYYQTVKLLTSSWKRQPFFLSAS